MAIEVFNRFEIKYMIKREELEDIRRELEAHMRLDAYNIDGFYSINNIYYDTHDNHLIRTSLSKPKYKQKVRLRGYGVPGPDDLVYLEIKKKFKGLVNKRRTSIKLSEARTFIETAHKPPIKSYMNRQVLNELEYILQDFHLEPKLYLAYDRIAYFSKGGHDLRVTFDTNIRTRRYDLSLDAGDYGDKLLSDEFILMEVKAQKCFPLWITHMLSKNKLYKVSFSKYGTEYKQLLKEEKGSVRYA